MLRKDEMLEDVSHLGASDFIRFLVRVKTQATCSRCFESIPFDCTAYKFQLKSEFGYNNVIHYVCRDCLPNWNKNNSLEEACSKYPCPPEALCQSLHLTKALKYVSSD